MEEKTHSPGNIWDTVFKKNMADTATALSFIRRNMPENFVALCDLTTLSPLPADFIDNTAHAEYRADVVYSAQTLTGNGQVIFLIEHQSSADPLMAWRVLHYSVNLMNACQRQNGVLPGIVSMMVYHGRTRLKSTQTWLSLIQPDALREVMREQFFTPLIQIDLGACPDEEIITHGASAPLELLLKHGRQPPERLLTSLIPLLFNGEYSPAQQREILRDTSLILGLEGKEEILRQIKLINSKYEVNMIDAITRLEMESMEKGMAKGKAEGIAEGIRSTAFNFLKYGVDPQIIAKSTGLSLDEISRLKAAPHSDQT